MTRMMLMLVWCLTALVADFAACDDDNLLNAVFSIVDDHIASIKMSSFRMPDFSYDYLLGTVSFTAGTLGNFSSLKGSPGDVFRRTDCNGFSVYRYELTLEADLNLRYSLDATFFGYEIGRGTLEASLLRGGLPTVTGNVILRSDGSCEAILDSALLSEDADLEVSIRPSSKYWRPLEKLVELLMEALYPSFAQAANTEIEKQVKGFIPYSQFSNVVCKPFYKLSITNVPDSKYKIFL